MAKLMLFTAVIIAIFSGGVSIDDKCAACNAVAMNKDNQRNKSDEASTRSDSSKVGDVFPSTSLEEYANKSGKVTGITGHLSVLDHGHHDDDDNDDDARIR